MHLADLGLDLAIGVQVSRISKASRGLGEEKWQLGTQIDVRHYVHSFCELRTDIDSARSSDIIRKHLASQVTSAAMVEPADLTLRRIVETTVN